MLFGKKIRRAGSTPLALNLTIVDVGVSLKIFIDLLGIISIEFNFLFFTKQQNNTFCKFIRLRRTSPPASTRSTLSRSETSSTRWTRIIFGSETPHHFSMCFLFIFGFWVLICEIVLCVLCFYFILFYFFLVMRFRCLIYCL